MKPHLSIVWFKKDLRIQDHKPLYDAIHSGVPVIGIFCFEPSIMNQGDFSGFHKQALEDSLRELTIALKNIGIQLLIFNNELTNTLQLINTEYIIHSIYAHQETGNRATYKRDSAVSAWCKEHGIVLHETPTNGIVRGLKNRDQRDGIWKRRMSQQVYTVNPSDYTSGDCILSDHLKNQVTNISGEKIYSCIQPTGESQGRSILHSFLNTRYSNYLYHIGKPYESMKTGSRLSVHLTYGNLSIKQVYHASQNKKTELKNLLKKVSEGSPEYIVTSSHLKHLNAFISRLHRHDHFIQKLETEVEYETCNIHPYYDYIRNTPNHERLDRFKAGMTGFPLIDAAIRCIKITGRINFRLRATLVSFICNTCLQDRKEIVHFFSIYWTDYEPGIHYPQFQMQSGTTGINQYRIYNPTKQMLEKDSEGKFVDIWCPELKKIPMPVKAEPWKLSQGLFQGGFGMRLGIDYPSPLFDLDQQNTVARKILRDLKKKSGFNEIVHQIYLKHGSRMKQKNRKR